ncbi:MAG TPA: ATP-dependent helicase HrpB [Rhodanobacteraceae bacterium]|nr:ATP-dependent helicase HrpB [Rhodanobacteraceae bacterium]
MPSARQDLPITPLLPALRAALGARTRVVLEAPPGTGKTTRVPPALLDEAWLAGRKVILLEPRRIAARAAADFMAAQRGEAVGQTVGYRIRFEARVSTRTRIEVVTEGILTRMLQDDPELAGVGALLFDEFHERHLAADLGIALALDVQSSLRPDLRIVVMSATLDGQRVAGWLDAPVLRSEGRAYPVRIEYPLARRGEDDIAQLRRGIENALAATGGDVLVFLPGRREIARVQRMLEPLLHTGAPPSQAGLGESATDGEARSHEGAIQDPFPTPPQARESPRHATPCVQAARPPTVHAQAAIEVLPLHGELPIAAQRAALAPPEAGVRRVILATNVAESSITVPGVRAVVDTGLAREPRFDPNSGLTHLATVQISRASADQRAGRAGRVAAGLALRLWPQSRRLEPARTPEIAQADLSGLALELAAWGVGADGEAALRWLDPPPRGALAAGHELLQQLGALDADLRLSDTGRAMLALGTAPRLAAAAVHAPAALRPLIADLLALLESRLPLHGEGDDDLRAQAAALHAWRDGGTRAARGADARALAAIEQVARGWRRRLEIRHGASGTPGATTVGDLLLHAFPDRAARQDARDPRRYQLANGRGARLGDASALFGEPWLVVVDARFDARDSLIRVAVPFDPALLERDFPRRCGWARAVEINANDVVEVREELRFGAIVLERRAVPTDPADALPALLARIRSRGIESLPWSDAALRLRARIAWLRRALPDTGLPDVSDGALLATLETWLAPALAGHRKLAALSAEALSRAFADLLDFQQHRRLDADAPDAIGVPSGRTLKLDYAVEPTAGAAIASPVLAVKLQELFGLAETPRIAHGRVPVTLHLLSPAGRPIQVTQDLRGFWDHTYAEVKKELKGRYPRHPWPDDPWNAIPTHRANARH